MENTSQTKVARHELNPLTFNSAYIAQLISHMEQEVQTNLDCDKDKICVAFDDDYYDSEGEFCEYLDTMFVTLEAYEKQPCFYSIDDLHILETKFVEAENTRDCWFRSEVVSQERIKGQSTEFSDGTHSTETTTFNTGLVLINRSDSCPGASRRTQNLYDGNGKCLAYFTYCEDAGNKSGDQELLRALDRASGQYRPSPKVA